MSEEKQRESPGPDPSASSQRPPPQIPDHELIRKIGGGSYGEVWLARSIMGTYRAVKVVYRDSFDHDRPFDREFNGIQRFEPISRSHESQVDILHVGRSEGYFYYVMELADDAGEGPKAEGRNPKVEKEVSSDPVRASGFDIPSDFGIRNSDFYMPRTLGLELHRRGKLPSEECLAIILSLTTALEHLHKHGLVHRDIKPSNIIFVHGIPKLADIGLVTSVDATRSYVGTEGFLPPEGPGTPQADIYSLGKVLYEMVSGRDRQDFPELPTNLGELSDRAGMLELNAIVAKACRNNARQRYQTAEEMHADLLLLQTGKSVRRLHRMERQLARATRVGVAAALVALLAVGAYLVAHNQAQRARESAAMQSMLRLEAETEKRKAQTEAAKSERLAGLLADVFEGVGPSIAKGRDPTMLREILDKAAEQIGKELTNQAEVEVELRDTLGGTYWRLGEFVKAEEMHRKALPLAKTAFGEASVATVSLYRSLGADLYHQGKFADSEAACSEALARLKEIPNGDQWQRANLLEELAMALVGQGKPSAEALSRQALDLRIKLAGTNIGDVAISMQNRAVMFANDGKFAEAETLLKEAVPMVRQAPGDYQPSLAKGLGSLAKVLYHQSKLVEAEPLAREALTIQRPLLGNENPSVSITLFTLSLVLTQVGKSEEAVAMYRDALAESRKVNGDGRVSYGLRLAQLLDDAGQETEAEGLAQEALNLARKVEGDGSAHAANALGALLRILLKEKKFDEYEQAVREILMPTLLSNPKSPALLGLRAQYFGHWSRWKEAGGDAARVIELSPAGFEAYHLLTAALVASEDQEGYRSHCQRMLARFGRTTDTLAALATAMDCLILPNPGADLATVGKLAQVASQVTTNHPQFGWSRLCQGLAQYREGQFASAADHVRQATEGAPKPALGFQGSMVLAMAQSRLNQTDAAGAAFTRGTQIEHVNLPDFEKSGYRDADKWVDWVLAHALQKQARTLMNGAPATNPETKSAPSSSAPAPLLTKP